MKTIQPLKAGIVLALCLIASAYCQIELATNVTIDPCSSASYTINRNTTLVNPYFTVTIVTANTFTGSLAMTITDGNGLQANATYSSVCSITSAVKTCTVEITCKTTDSPVWYANVASNANVMVTYNISYIESTYDLQTLDGNNSWNVTAENRTLAQNPTFAEIYDFYHFSMPQYLATSWNYLNISITSAPANGIKAVYINNGAIASPENACVYSMTTNPQQQDIIINTCQLATLYENTQFNGDWYISVQPNSAVVTDAVGVDYTLYVTLTGPTITQLAAPSNASTIYFLSDVGDIAYYAFNAPATSSNLMNVTIKNVEGGSVDVSVLNGVLPYTTCASSSITNCTTDSVCQLILDSCFVEASSTYYIAVRAKTQSSPVRLVSYQLAVAFLPRPTPATLQQATYATGSVLQNQYQHFKISPSKFSVNSQTLLNVHLYMDASNGVPITLYVNYDNPAGSNTASCYSNFNNCTLSTVGACTVQINPCDYNDHSSWYVSVFGSNSSAIYGFGTRYTVRAELENPTVLSTNYLANSAVLGAGEYDHYRVDSSLLKSGSSLSLVFSSVSGGTLTVYKRYGGLAGNQCTSTDCYNNIATTTISTSTSTITLNNCQGDINEDVYYGVFANSPTKGTSYNVAVIPSTGPMKSSQVLKESTVLVDSITGISSKNYSMNVGGYSGKSTPYQLVFTLTYVQAQGTFAGLTATIYNTTYLNCLNSYQLNSCTIQANTVTCQIVIDPCVLSANNGYTLLVSSAGGATTVVNYNLQYEVISLSPTVLKSGVAVANDVGQNQYDQYTYAARAQNTTVTVEVYFDSNQNANGYLYVGDSSATGKTGGCFSNTYSCKSSSKCVYVVNSCDVQKGTMYMSVYTDTALGPVNPLRYTIKVTEQSAIVPLTLSTPQDFKLYPTQEIYHSFTVPTVNATQGQVVYVEIGNVQGGQVTGYLSFGQVLNTCPCFEYLYTVTSSAITNSGSLRLEYCDIDDGAWTFMIQASSNTPTELVAYTLTVLSVSSNPVALVAGNPPIAGQARNSQYNYYQLSSTIPQTSQVVLTITNVRGGSVSVSANDVAPATQNCRVTSLAQCTGVTNSCTEQIGSCLSNLNYFSVFGIATTADPVYYDIEVDIVAITALTEGQGVTTSVAPRFFDQYQYTLPAGKNAPLVQISVNVTAGRANIAVYNDKCGVPIASGSCTAQNCILDIANCQLTELVQGGLIFSVSSASTTNPANYTISAITVDTAEDVTVITNNVNGNLGPQGWKTYSYAVTNLPYPSKKLVVSVVPKSLNAYLQYTDFPQLNNCNYGSLTVDTCCLQTGNYYISVYNSGASNVDYNVTVNLVDTVSVVSLQLGETQSNVGAAGVLVENQFAINENVNFTQILTSSVVVQASTNNTANFYLQRISYAGNDDTCFTSYDGCNPGLSCNLQFFECNSQGPLQGTYQLGVVSNAPFTNVTVGTSLYYTTSLSLTPTATPGTATPGIVNTYSVFVDASQASILDKLVITVTPSAGAVRTRLSSGTLPACSGNDVLATCTSNPCVITYDLASQVGLFFIDVTATGVVDATYDISTVINSTGVQSLTNPSTNTNVDKTPLYFYSNVTSFNSTNLLQLQVTGTDITTVQWTYMGLYSWSAPIACATGCIIELDSCTIPETPAVIYLAVNSLPGANFTVSSTILSPTINNLVVGDDFPGQLTQVGAEDYFTVTLDRSKILPGQTVTFSLDNECGTSQMYINDNRGLAGSTCNIKTLTNSFTVDACSLLTDVANAAGSNYFITVTGTSQPFGANVPIRYSLTITISDSVYTFTPLAPSQLIPYDPAASTVYVYSIDGGGATYAGDTTFQLTLPQAATSSSSGILIGTDVAVPICGPSTLSCTVATGKTSCSVTMTQCALSSVSQVYVAFGSTTVPGATLEVIRRNPYIRDWNADGLSTVQSGSVVPSSQGPWVDQEQYVALINPAQTNFRLTVSLQTNTGSATVYVSQGTVPGHCSSNTISCTAASGTCQYTINGCDLEPNVPLYMTVVGGAAASANPVPYNLTLTQTVSSTVLTVNKPICGTVGPKSYSWYTIKTTVSALNYVAIEVYSIAQGSLTVTASALGLATSSCNEASVATCSGECVLNYICTSNGADISVGVYNGNSYEDSFYIRWSLETATPVALGFNVTTTVSVTDATIPYFFSLSTAGLGTNLAGIDFQSAKSTDVVYFSTSQLPSSYCNDGETKANGVSILYADCQYVATGQNIYFAVYTTATAFSLTPIQVPVTPNTLTLNVYAEKTIPVGSVHTYTFQLTAQQINAISILELSVYGVNQGTVDFWINKGTSLQPMECSQIGFGDNSVKLLLPCDIDATSYTIGIIGKTQTSTCVPVTYGVIARVNSPDYPITTVTLGNPVTTPVGGSKGNGIEFYTFNVPTAGTSSNALVIKTTVEAPNQISMYLIDSPNLKGSIDCSLEISQPLYYNFGCDVPAGDYLLWVMSDNPSAPGVTYTIQPSLYTSTQIKENTAVTYTFTAADDIAFFNLIASDAKSVVFDVNVLVGPSVTVEIFNGNCSSNLAKVTDYTCFFGHCQIPFSWSSDIVNSTLFSVVVTGSAPSSFNISYTVGSSNCAKPTGLNVCSAVNYNVWNFNNAAWRDSAAGKRYEQLYQAFCPPCQCRGLSESCNKTLVQYACAETFRACDSAGYQATPCKLSCTNVEDSCGQSFTDVGLSELECSHNWYQSNSEKVCKSYSSLTGGNGLSAGAIVGIILGIIVLLLIIVALVGLGFFGYKQYLARKSSGGYDVIEG